MSLPELIPSNLPVFTRKTPRSSFANSVVPQGFALLLAQSDSNGGVRFVTKNSDGSYTDVGGGGSANVTLGVVDSNGKFQPLKFDGTDASESGSPETVQNYKSWNSTYPVPTPAPVSSMNFYKCASVDTSNSTWSGHLAELHNGIYKYASDSTSGLTYSTAYIPEVGKTYSENAMITAELWTITSDSLVFYTPLSASANTAATGQDLVEEGNVTFQTVDAIPCAYSDTTCGIRTNTQVATIDTGVPKSISVWVNIIQFNQNEDYQGVFCSMQWGGGSTFYYVKDSASSGHLVFSRWSTGGEGSYVDLQLGTLNLNTWYHFAIVDTGTEMKGFVNGTLIQTANVSSYYQKTENDWYFGLSYMTSSIDNMPYNLIGYMAAPRIYSRALSENEVLALSKEFTPTA